MNIYIFCKGERFNEQIKKKIPLESCLYYKMTTCLRIRSEDCNREKIKFIFFSVYYFFTVAHYD